MANESRLSTMAARGPLHAGASTNRSRRTVAVEEDASKLQFGDFAEGEALTPTDVQAVLEAVRAAPGAPAAPDNKVYKLASEYVNEFSNASMDVVNSMRAALDAQGGFLNKFEKAQIMYLRPPRVEVAVALIPSLERYSHGGEDETKLQQLLDDVVGMARYGGQA